METREVTKNGVTVTYGIEDNHVVIFNPNTGEPFKKVSLEKPTTSGSSTGEVEGWDDFQNCMRGCYSPAQGDNWALAGCIALCSTLIFT